MRIACRLLEEDDLGWFGRWLADPDVDRWFHTEDPERLLACRRPDLTH